LGIIYIAEACQFPPGVSIPRRETSHISIQRVSRALFEFIFVKNPMVVVMSQIVAGYSMIIAPSFTASLYLFVSVYLLRKGIG